ncbi:hypothetical protein T01_9514 [Trichinella spiralis]|uniref:Uncharacterized protein n=1 Tax=Trichinella spiralis TaxID=6334 RepID=A0A0V1B6T3_TRISP|nr:hypothetical protein T01_9514 [Trichinella spiralis]
MAINSLFFSNRDLFEWFPFPSISKQSEPFFILKFTLLHVHINCFNINRHQSNLQRFYVRKIR